jgi:MoaA/NifB/PqqE/SkfB family radical SAM enzyme
MTPHLDLLRARLDSIAIEVTSKCNLRCSYCPKADDVLEAMPGANDDMTDEMIGALYRYCKEAEIKNVTLSVVGETTMFPGWHKRIAQFLDDPEIAAHMVSNFQRLLSDEDLEALTKFSALQISFDSSELEMVRKLRGKADLRTITYNIIRLRQKGRELGRHPFLLVNCTLCRDNIAHIGKLAGFCRELGVDQLMITEVMTVTTHNPKMPQTVDTLTNDDVILLAQQLITAEEALLGSNTALRLREHLEVRIAEVIEQIREGKMPANAAAYFNRRMDTSACRQPWQSPLIGAIGKVNACCGDPASTIGQVGPKSFREIIDDDPARALRASILEGRPTVACHNCSFANKMSFTEFTRDLREWLGDTNLPSHESQTYRTVWPGLLGSSEYPVVIENLLLRVGHGGVAALIEDRLNGMHRVLFDVEPSEYATISFRARPTGRRRFRLDFAERATMVGRAHIVLTREPRVDIPIGAIRCQVTRANDGWYDVKGVLPVPKLFSNINVTLMREDNAVTYGGDGCSGLDLSGFCIGRSSDASSNG